jgi:hypothetical protein
MELNEEEALYVCGLLGRGNQPQYGPPVENYTGTIYNLLYDALEKAGVENVAQRHAAYGKVVGDKHK